MTHLTRLCGRLAWLGCVLCEWLAWLGCVDDSLDSAVWMTIQICCTAFHLYRFWITCILSLAVTCWQCRWHDLMSHVSSLSPIFCLQLAVCWYQLELWLCVYQALIPHAQTLQIDPRMNAVMMEIHVFSSGWPLISFYILCIVYQYGDNFAVHRKSLLLILNVSYSEVVCEV